MRNINLCLHDVVAAPSDIGSVYDITVDQLKQVIETASGTIDEGIADGFTLYFDDSYISLVERVLPANRPASSRVTTAVITDTINKPHHLSERDIVDCLRAGVVISSHGVSHAALASFSEKDVLFPTPTGGAYANKVYGKGSVLTANEVLFQLRESQQKLEGICQKPITELVVPYGLYNRQTLEIAAELTTYETVATCHSAIDVGHHLKPRHLVTQENIGRLALDLPTLGTKFALLY